MASTYNNLGIEKPGTGEQSGTWGNTANNNYDFIAAAICGAASLVKADSNETLTMVDGAASDNRNKIIIFSGALTANRDLTFAPADLTKEYLVINNTTGGFSIVFKQGTGATPFTLANGKSAYIYLTGSNSVSNALANATFTTITASGQVTSNGNNVVESTRTITTGAGLDGGGDLSANRTLTLDVSDLTEDTAPDMDADFLASYDTSGTATKKVKPINLIPEFNRKGSDIASATTLVKPSDANLGLWHDITGTVTITGFWNDAALNRLLLVRFTGILTLTHNATSLILPGGANITTAANDRAIMYHLGSGNWICVNYIRASGQPVTQVATSSIADDAVSYAKIQNVTDERLLGRAAGSTGDVQEITVSGLTLAAGVLSANGITAALYQDQKANGSDGGSSTSGSWQDRVLNTEVFDTIGASVSSNAVTLPAGTYVFYGVGSHYANSFQHRLLNSSDSTVIALGGRVDVGISGFQQDSTVIGATTLATSKAVKLQYRTETSRASDGLGQPTSWSDGVEVYASLLIVKIA
jgi:hypothetical protein